MVIHFNTVPVEAKLLAAADAVDFVKNHEDH